MKGPWKTNRRYVFVFLIHLGFIRSNSQVICGKSQADSYVLNFKLSVAEISHPSAPRKKNKNDREEERKERLKIGRAKSKTPTTKYTPKIKDDD